jgi:methyl-accepting chemotaxis protein
MKLSIKIGLVALVLVVTMTFFGVFAMNTLKNNLIDSRKHEIQSILTFSLNQARDFVELEKANKITREEAEEGIVRLFSNMRDGNYFLWANDANGIARVHIKDNVIGVFQSSYARYIGYLSKNPFMFVVIESEKANSNALYVKVNGMTLLPEWNWMLGIGVYVDELESEIHQFAISLIIASIVMFLAIFSVVFWVYRSVIYQLGDDPQTVIELVSKAEKEGFQDTENDDYSHDSLLNTIRNFYLHIHSILNLLRSQNQSLSKDSVDLVYSAKGVAHLIDAAANESKRVDEVLSRNEKKAQKIHSRLASSEQYLDIVTSRVTDNITINTNNEKEFKKIEASLIGDTNALLKLSQHVHQLDVLIETFSDAKHSDSLGQAKVTLSELEQGIEALKVSVQQSGGELTQFLSSFGEQRLSLESVGENLINVKQQIEQIVQAQESLFNETPNELDQHFDEILSSLNMVTELVLKHKTQSDKMIQDMDSINF